MQSPHKEVYGCGHYRISATYILVGKLLLHRYSSSVLKQFEAVWLDDDDSDTDAADDGDADGLVVVRVMAM